MQPRPSLRAGDWVDRGACAGSPDPDIWHAPEKYVGNSHRLNADSQAALAVCRNGCEVLAQCLAFALARPVVDDWGIWGGTTERERRAMRDDRERVRAKHLRRAS